MTPPHIEKAARAMKRTEIKKMVSGILSPASIDAHVDASWKTCIPAATLVWSLAIEEAAKVGEALAAEMEAEMRTASLSGDTALRERAVSVRSGANTCVYRIRALAVGGWMDTSRDLPMSDENIAMIISAAEKECSERAKNKRPEMSIYDLEKRINATIPEYMRVPIMDTLCEMAEDARRQARRYAELNARIAYIRRHTTPPKGEKHE